MSVGIVFQVFYCISFDSDLVLSFYFILNRCAFIESKPREFFLSIVVWARLFFFFETFILLRSLLLFYSSVCCGRMIDPEIGSFILHESRDAESF
jgi:hypothetical protein